MSPRLRPRLEVLEERLTPTVLGVSDVRTAYGIDNISFGGTAGDGTGQVIAIVDAYNSPTLFSDLDSFDQGMYLTSAAPQTLYQQYGAASSFLKVFNQSGVDISAQIGNSGSGGVPGVDSTGGWEGEAALDVEWAHAIAPGARIDLVESNYATSLFNAMSTAAGLAGVSVVSMSWGSHEWAGETSADSNLTWPGGHVPVTFLAATGDSSSADSYPAYSPRVVAVGGTSLTLNWDSTYNHETHWSSGGHGVSTYESEPAFQTGQGSFGKRSIPDVSLVADPGVWVYDSFSGGDWSGVGGTSLSCPCWAGLVAIANQGRVLAGGTSLKGPTQTLPALYSLPASDYNVISGSSFSLTGLGSPVASLAVPDLAAYGMASQLAVTTQPPGTVTAGRAFTVVVKALDPFGHLDRSYNGSVTIGLGNNPGGSTLGGTVTVNAVNGVATFSTLSLNKVGTGYTLQASSGSLTQATTSSFNVKAAATTQLVVTTGPPGSVTVGNTFTVAVSAEDAYGNVDTTYSSSVTLALLDNPGGSTLGGTLTVTPSSGVATFSNLTLNKVGDGYTLKATTASLSSATTSGFNVVATAATHLVVTAQPPASVTAGNPFGLAVQVEDAYGNLDPSYSGTISVAIASNPAAGTLGGTVALNAVNGVATFSTLTLDKVGLGYSLEAISGSLSSATTSGINVTAGSATQLVITTGPPGSVTAGNTFTVAVSAEDPYGNIDPTYSSDVTLALLNNPGGSTVTPSNGVATFSNLTLDQTGSGYTLRATSSGLSSATTTGITVTPAAATQLVVTTQPPASVTAGNPFGLAVQAEDAYGNLDPTYSATISVALATSPTGSTLGGTLTVTAVNGVATFSTLTLNRAGNGCTLQASSASLTQATTSSFSVHAAAATHLVILSAPSGLLAPRASFRIKVAAEDALGNVDLTFAGAVQLRLASAPPGGVVHGAQTVTAVAGYATFTALSLSGGGPYTLGLGSGALTPTQLGLTRLAYQLALPAVKEDATSPAGVKVSTLLQRQSKPGIAVTQCTGNGVWEYSANGKKWLRLGRVTPARPRLLPASYQVRFVPARHWTGQASLVFLTWDGRSAFGIAPAKATVRVTAPDHG